MNNVLGEALKQAINKSEFSNFVWKGEKVKEGDKYVQNTELIGDMSKDRLKQCYNHCLKMLNNDDVKNLGRLNVLKEVSEQINKCNVELFLRYCENTYQRNERNSVSRNSLRISLRQFIENTNEKLTEQGKKEIEDWSDIPISEAASQLPDEFKDISISDVMDGCIDYLGAMTKQHLTMTFITKMGMWFTKVEENEIKANSNTERLKIAKEKLHLPEKLVLRLSEKGLSYHEMRAMLILSKRQKYSDMTTEQLVTLKNKVLPRLEKEIDRHIYNWKKLKKQIEIVAKYKNIDLNDLN